MIRLLRVQRPSLPSRGVRWITTWPDMEYMGLLVQPFLIKEPEPEPIQKPKYMKIDRVKPKQTREYMPTEEEQKWILDRGLNLVKNGTPPWMRWTSRPYQRHDLDDSFWDESCGVQRNIAANTRSFGSSDVKTADIVMPSFIKVYKATPDEPVLRSFCSLEEMVKERLLEIIVEHWPRMSMADKVLVAREVMASHWKDCPEEERQMFEREYYSKGRAWVQKTCFQLRQEYESLIRQQNRNPVISVPSQHQAAHEALMANPNRSPVTTETWLSKDIFFAYLLGPGWEKFCDPDERAFIPLVAKSETEMRDLIMPGAMIVKRGPPNGTTNKTDNKKDNEDEKPSI